MSWRRERELAAYFDEVVADGIMVDFEPDERAPLEGLLARLAAQPGESVLEPGCGAGRLTELLAQGVGPEGSVLGFDVSTAMVARAAARGLPPWARVVRASASRVPAADRSVDLAICFSVFPHLEDRPAALAELARVVRPGGRAWVAHLACRDAINGFHAGLDGPVRHHLLPTTDELAEMLSDAGFDVLEQTDSESDGYRVGARRR